MELAAAAMLVAIGVAIPLGVLAAVRKGTAIDAVSMTLALTGISVPDFWLGPLLAIVFAVQLQWLPVSGRGTWAHLVLPAVSLGAGLAAILARMTRATLLEELREPYVEAARARGASRGPIVLGHALRNGMIPIATVLGLQFGNVLTGAVITETIFAWPGVGRLLIQSIGFRDYPVVQGCILFIATTYVLVNLATDLAYGALDPRMPGSSDEHGPASLAPASFTRLRLARSIAGDFQAGRGHRARGGPGRAGGPGPGPIRPVHAGPAAPVRAAPAPRTGSGSTNWAATSWPASWSARGFRGWLVWSWSSCPPA